MSSISFPIRIPSKIYRSGVYPENDLKKFFVKRGVGICEYRVHRYVYGLGIVNVPKVVSYDEATKIMVLQKIHGTSLADMYGEDASNIDDDLFEKMRHIIQILRLHNIEYPDITGYNFMIDLVKKDTLWIVDFGHAKYSGNIKNEFILKFCNGHNEWNPEFK